MSTEIILGRLDAFLQVAAKRAETIDVGLDGVLPEADRVGRKRGEESIGLVGGLEWYGEPGRIGVARGRSGAIEERAGEQVVPVGVDDGRDVDAIPEDSLDREASAVDLGANALDLHTPAAFFRELVGIDRGASMRHGGGGLFERAGAGGGLG